MLLLVCPSVAVFTLYTSKFRWLFLSMLTSKLSVRVYDFDVLFSGVTLKLMEGTRPNLKVVPIASTSTIM